MNISIWEAELTRRMALSKTPDERKSKGIELWDAAERQESRQCRQAANYLRDLAAIWLNPPADPFTN